MFFRVNLIRFLSSLLFGSSGIETGAYFYGASQQGHTTSDHQLIGSVVATILVVVVTVQIALDTAYWTVFNHITIWGSLVWYFALQYFYNFVIGGSYVGSLTKVNFQNSEGNNVDDRLLLSGQPNEFGR